MPRGPSSGAPGGSPAAPSGSRSEAPTRVDPQARSRRRRRIRRTLLAVVAAFALLAVLVGLAEQLLLSRYEHNIRQGDLLSPNARRHGAPVKGPLNYLLLGSDARPGGSDTGERSDTIIIMHVPAAMNGAYLVSIPRDLRVDIPADGSVDFPGGTDKINASFSYGTQQGHGEEGGFRLLSATLRQLTGVSFDGAAIIDFTGFQKVVQVLGGVDLCVDSPTTSIHTGTVYQPGCQYMRPWQALDYVRQRYDQPNGDYDRQRHQQQFLKAILRRAKDQGVVTNPVKLDATLRAVGQSLTLDTNGVALDRLAYALRNVGPGGLVGLRLPSHPDDADGVSYVVADDDAATLYQAIRDDKLKEWARAHPEWVNPL